MVVHYKGCTVLEHLYVNEIKIMRWCVCVVLLLCKIHHVCLCVCVCVSVREIERKDSEMENI